MATRHWFTAAAFSFSLAATTQALPVRSDNRPELNRREEIFRILRSERLESLEFLDDAARSQLAGFIEKVHKGDTQALEPLWTRWLASRGAHLSAVQRRAVLDGALRAALRRERVFPLIALVAEQVRYVEEVRSLKVRQKEHLLRLDQEFEAHDVQPFDIGDGFDSRELLKAQIAGLTQEIQELDGEKTDLASDFPQFSTVEGIDASLVFFKLEILDLVSEFVAVEK